MYVNVIYSMKWGGPPYNGREKRWGNEEHAFKQTKWANHWYTIIWH